MTGDDIQIYCDGSCLGNPGVGGWAAIHIKNNKIVRELFGYVANTTNNKMELTAAYEGLLPFANCVDKKISIFTDSIYVQKGITEWIFQWKKKNWKNVKNISYWQRLDELNGKCEVSWEWVKAHNGNIYNERVDSLARRAAQQKISSE